MAMFPKREFDIRTAVHRRCGRNGGRRILKSNNDVFYTPQNNKNEIIHRLCKKTEVPTLLGVDKCVIILPYKGNKKLRRIIKMFCWHF